ncbi:MAG: hypothetical protein U0Y10_10150 [Spirosomataceae bacterium]
MKRFSVFISLMMVGWSCGINDVTPTQQDEALLSHMLYVDGCDWTLTLRRDAAVSYAPNESSLSIIQSYVDQQGGFQFGVFSQNVSVSYQPTNRKTTINCGWGRKETLDEIEIKAIKKL